MSDDDYLVGLIKEFRTTDLERRVEIASKILAEIDVELRLFIFGLITLVSQRDVFQETQIAIFTSLKTFKGNTRKQFLAWCRTIARRKASDERRKQGFIRMEPFPLEDGLEFVMEPIDPSEPLTADKKLDLEYALNLLDKSKPDCRELLWNYYVIGMDYDELAEQLALKYDGVRMRIVRCLQSAQGLL